MRRITLSAALSLALAACGQADAPRKQSDPVITPVAVDAPAGTYRADPSHTSVIFRVDHIGMSNYTARFLRVDAVLDIDPADPATARVTASIDPASLTLDNAPDGFFAEMQGPNWFRVAQFPDMRFASTSVTLTGEDAADIVGDFTMLGVTRPVTLHAKFNGAYRGHPQDPNARIGFSATGVLKRSEFGLDIGLPPPGSTMGVSDEVEIIIETEMLGPPLETQETAQ